MIIKVFLTSLLLVTIAWATTCSAEILTLEDAVQMALSNHQRILQAGELYSARSASAEAAARERLPSIDFSFSYDRLNDNPFQTIAGSPLTTRDKDQVHYQIRVEQPLFTGFHLSIQKKLAELDVDIARYNLQQARRTLALDVHVAALQLLQTEALQRLAKQQCSQLESHLADIRAAYDQGMVPGNDRLKAEVALAAASQQLRSITNRATLIRSKLNLLLNLPQQDPLTIIEPQAIPQPQQSLQQLTTTALEKRPEILSAKAAIASANEKVQLSHSNDYPHLALVASYWRDGDNLTAAHNSYTNHDNATIGIHLDWNLFSGGADRARSAASQHEQRAKQQALFELKDLVRLQVEEAFKQLDVVANNEKTATKALEQAQENHRLSVLQFHENIISTSDLLAAQTLQTRADANLQIAHYGYLLAAAQLSFALGEDPLPATEKN